MLDCSHKISASARFVDVTEDMRQTLIHCDKSVVDVIAIYMFKGVP